VKILQWAQLGSNLWLLACKTEMISTDTQVMHGQAVIAGTRVPVSAILDCLAAGMSAEEITAEYPTVTVPGVRAAAACGAALAREELLPFPGVTVTRLSLRTLTSPPMSANSAGLHVAHA
jgi:uncharacterized protein (DUF433 family)